MSLPELPPPDCYIISHKFGDCAPSIDDRPHQGPNFDSEPMYSADQMRAVQAAHPPVQPTDDWNAAIEAAASLFTDSKIDDAIAAHIRRLKR